MNNNSYNGFSNSSMYYGNINKQSTTPDIPKEYIENILKTNKGKKVSIYQSFSETSEWKDKIFNGIIEEAGKDYIVLSDPTTGNWFLLLMKYVDYIKFDEEIKH